MARNEEKHYGRLNRLLLSKEREEYKKNHPQRPKLDSLFSVEEIQKWLPSIKQDIDFYLKKSQVICYSDQHIEECRMKVNKLEKEYKAFVLKIKQLTPGTLDAVPWTNRAYKRKNIEPIETKLKKNFMPIACPILQDNPLQKTRLCITNMPLLDKPLFNLEKEQAVSKSNISLYSKDETINTKESCISTLEPVLQNIEDDQRTMSNSSLSKYIVNYEDSSGTDSS